MSDDGLPTLIIGIALVAVCWGSYLLAKIFIFGGF